MNNNINGFSNMSPTIEGIAPTNTGIPNNNENPVFPVESNETNNLNPEIAEVNGVAPHQVAAKDEEISENPQTLSTLEKAFIKDVGGIGAKNDFARTLGEKSFDNYSVDITKISKN